MRMTPQYKEMLLSLLVEMYQRDDGAIEDDETMEDSHGSVDRPILTQSTIAPVGG